MARLIRHALLALVAVAVSMFGVIGVLSRTGRVELPPCVGCHQAGAQLDEVSVCDLEFRRQELKDKLVRVRGIFRNDSGYLFLENPGCSVHLGFAPGRLACKNAYRKLQIICGIDAWYDGRATVRLLGTPSRIPVGNFFEGDEGFTILCLEEVVTEPTMGRRWRFALDRIQKW